MKSWKKREKALLLSHKDPATSPHLAVGRPLDVEGRLYVITRWRELPPVALARGGSTREWEIWGRPLNDAEVNEALSAALQQILDDPEGEPHRGA